MTGSARVIRGNALALPLADASVDLVVTSPPYFGLRSYQDGGEHYDGQIGDEATPAEFVDALLAATREMVRVVKPSGSIWVNLGDKYNAYNGGRGPGSIQDNEPRQDVPRGNGLDVKGLRPKSLIGVPWRYALRCIDDLGLILRAEVIWSKPNGLPESVTDRVRRSHETWFHFTREPRYFSAVDEVREEHSEHFQRYSGRIGGRAEGRDSSRNDRASLSVAEANPLGKLPGSVWTIPTQPLRVPDHLGVDHFAAFPMEWPRRIIRGWSPSGICVACGEGRRPVVVKDGGRPVARAHRHLPGYADPAGEGTRDQSYTITGYACACPEPPADTTPAVVLDPFGGTGTTALVAKALGRHGISVDMSADYCRLAEWRTNDPGELARAMQVKKPPAEIPDQLDIFGGDAA